MPIAVGLAKGYPVTKKARPERRAKGVSGSQALLTLILTEVQACSIVDLAPVDNTRCCQAKTAKLTTCREVVREVVGLLQYERRLLDMLKTGGASSEKRMYKFAKKRVCALRARCHYY